MDPRPAATVILGRPAAGGVEVLVLRRSERSRFAPGFVVFPGGVVEPGDRDLASRLFGDPAEAARACAVRELHEEAGLVLAPDGLLSRPPGPVTGFPRPPAGALVEISRWVAPEFLETRFDARFFAVSVPRGVDPSPDGVEIAVAWWARPADVLEAHGRGAAALMWPTYVTLGALAGCASVEDVLALRMEQVHRPERLP